MRSEPGVKNIHLLKNMDRQVGDTQKHRKWKETQRRIEDSGSVCHKSIHEPWKPQVCLHFQSEVMCWADTVQEIKVTHTVNMSQFSPSFSYDLRTSSQNSSQ